MTITKGKILNLALFAIGTYIAVQMTGGLDGILNKNIADKLAPGNQVVMYSLTTCIYCKQKRQQMTSAGIPFSEVFIDTDPSKMQEFNNLLAAHYVPPGSVGTPTLVVNGELLLNNPSMADIKKHLKYKS